MNYKIHLQGLHCESCKKVTQKRLEKLQGVALVEVDLEKQTALVQTDNPLSQNDLTEALKDTEYKVTAIEEIN